MAATLSWLSALLEAYGVRSACLSRVAQGKALSGTPPGLWMLLRDGSALALLAHYYGGDAANDGGVDLRAVSLMPASAAERLGNLRVAAPVLSRLGVRFVVNDTALATMRDDTADAALLGADDDAALLQARRCWLACGPCPSPSSNACLFPLLPSHRLQVHLLHDVLAARLPCALPVVPGGPFASRADAQRARARFFGDHGGAALTFVADALYGGTPAEAVVGCPFDPALDTEEEATLPSGGPAAAESGGNIRPGSSFTFPPHAAPFPGPPVSGPAVSADASHVSAPAASDASPLEQQQQQQPPTAALDKSSREFAEASVAVEFARLYGLALDRAGHRASSAAVVALAHKWAEAKVRQWAADSEGIPSDVVDAALSTLRLPDAAAAVQPAAAPAPPPPPTPAEDAGAIVEAVAVKPLLPPMPSLSRGMLQRAPPASAPPLAVAPPADATGVVESEPATAAEGRLSTRSAAFTTADEPSSTAASSSVAALQAAAAREFAERRNSVLSTASAHLLPHVEELGSHPNRRPSVSSRPPIATGSFRVLDEPAAAAARAAPAATSHAVAPVPLYVAPPAMAAAATPEVTERVDGRRSVEPEAVVAEEARGSTLPLHAPADVPATLAAPPSAVPRSITPAVAVVGDVSVARPPTRVVGARGSVVSIAPAAAAAAAESLEEEQPAPSPAPAPAIALPPRRSSHVDVDGRRLSVSGERRRSIPLGYSGRGSVVALDARRPSTAAVAPDAAEPVPPPPLAAASAIGLLDTDSPRSRMAAEEDRSWQLAVLRAAATGQALALPPSSLPSSSSAGDGSSLFTISPETRALAASLLPPAQHPKPAAAAPAPVPGMAIDRRASQASHAPAAAATPLADAAADRRASNASHAAVGGISAAALRAVRSSVIALGGQPADVAAPLPAPLAPPAPPAPAAAPSPPPAGVYVLEVQGQVAHVGLIPEPSAAVPDDAVLVWCAPGAWPRREGSVLLSDLAAVHLRAAQGRPLGSPLLQLRLAPARLASAAQRTGGALVVEVTSPDGSDAQPLRELASRVSATHGRILLSLMGSGAPTSSSGPGWSPGGGGGGGGWGGSGVGSPVATFGNSAAVAATARRLALGARAWPAAPDSAGTPVGAAMGALPTAAATAAGSVSATSPPHLRPTRDISTGLSAPAAATLQPVYALAGAGVGGGLGAPGAASVPVSSATGLSSTALRLLAARGAGGGVGGTGMLAQLLSSRHSAAAR